MVNKSIKALLITCSVLFGTLMVLFFGILLRILGEALGFNNGESLTVLFAGIFLLSYIGVDLVERTCNES